MLLDAVRAFCLDDSLICSLIVACCSMFASTLSSALYILPSAGYGLSAKEFDVSVDEIASSFTASFLGLGLSAYVNLVSIYIRLAPDLAGGDNLLGLCKTH